MCRSRANLACSDFTRASVDIRSSLLYSSLGEVPIFRCSSFTASENADVAASYSVASRISSSQLTCHPSFIISGCPLHVRSLDTSDGAPGRRYFWEVSKTRQHADSARVYTFPMVEPIRILTVELEDGDGLLVTFSDGTIAGYVAEELLELRPFREPTAASCSVRHYSHQAQGNLPLV
jgi:hypothetical protein